MHLLVFESSNVTKTFCTLTLYKNTMTKFSNSLFIGNNFEQIDSFNQFLFKDHFKKF